MTANDRYWEGHRDGMADMKDRMQESFARRGKSALPELQKLRDEIEQLRSTINKAGGLACQGVSTEIIRQVLAEGLGTTKDRRPSAVDVEVQIEQDKHRKAVTDKDTCKHGVILYGNRCLNCEREACKHENTAAASPISSASVWCPDSEQWVQLEKVHD